MPLSTKGGKLNFLRVHEVGSKFGPPTDEIDVEVVLMMAGDEGAYGFQLRNDNHRPVRQGMLNILRDAFNHGWKAEIDVETPTGKKNGVIIRAALRK